jgi:hypothetical protein
MPVIMRRSLTTRYLDGRKRLRRRCEPLVFESWRRVQVRPPAMLPSCPLLKSWKADGDWPTRFQLLAPSLMPRPGPAATKSFPIKSPRKFASRGKGWGVHESGAPSLLLTERASSRSLATTGCLSRTSATRQRPSITCKLPSSAHVRGPPRDFPRRYVSAPPSRLRPPSPSARAWCGGSDNRTARPPCHRSRGAACRTPHRRRSPRNRP